MTNFVINIEKFIEKIDSFTGGTVLVILLLGIGIFFSIKLGFLQISKLGTGFKLMFGGLFSKENKKGSLSSFQALATAVAAQIGTGNVGGIATAIAVGGPGAIFWMWITAIVGMATIFAEAVLAQHFRERKDGELVGGPAYYITRGLGGKMPRFSKFLACFFAVAIILALGIAGNMVQSNSIAGALSHSFSIPTWIIGIALAVLAGLVFMGGVNRIGHFAETVVPFMAVIYILGSLALLIKFHSHLGEAFGLIFRGAFSAQAAAGGFLGATVKQAIRYGVQRGLFSNEAGMGSTPHAHAVADVKHPAEQGLIAMVGVFFDSIIICSSTALVIIATGSHMVEGLKGVAITQHAFTLGFGSLGGQFLSICLMFFAFTTIIGWYYFGESNVRYLFGEKALIFYRLFVILAIFMGAMLHVDFVWTLSGFLNNLMVYPNVIALLLLSPMVANIYRDYRAKKKAGSDISYNYPPDAK